MSELEQLVARQNEPKPKQLSSPRVAGPPPPKPLTVTQEKSNSAEHDSNEDSDQDWGDSDEEQEDETTQPTRDTQTGGFIPQSGDTGGPVMWVLDKGLDLVKQEAQRLRKVTLKITNESNKWVLVNPHWAFKNGKTEINPDYVIREGHTGEALFQGHTLKGMLTYEIAKLKDPGNSLALTTSNSYALLMIFKVLYFRGFEIKLFDLKVKAERKNKMDVKIVKASEVQLKDIEIKNGGMYRRHKDKMKHCAGRFHSAVPDSKDAPNLEAHFSISDTGESDIKVVVQDV